MNIACPECSTIFRVDPDRVPSGGVTARCRECSTAFQVEEGMAATAPGEFVVASRSGEAGAGGAGGADAGAGAGEPDGAESSGVPVFGPQDPETRARRLARALVSDIKVYHPDRWEESVRAGSLRTDFRDEIMKSWDEYVEQVGEKMAKKTPFFRDALNEILARGDRVF